jgi:hypothetical protein
MRTEIDKKNTNFKVKFFTRQVTRDAFRSTFLFMINHFVRPMPTIARCLSDITVCHMGWEMMSDVMQRRIRLLAQQQLRVTNRLLSRHLRH